MFEIDHDFHIHTNLSLCCGDKEQNTKAVFNYALNNKIKTVCITNHFWDETAGGASDWYKQQNFKHLSQILPLPHSDGVKMLFGCETDLDKHFRLGISKKTVDKFDFIAIPTTHLHMASNIDQNIVLEKDRAEIYVERLDKVLNMDLPFGKIGIAHLTCPLMASNLNDFDEHLRILDCISDKTFEELFSKMANLGVGFELNFNPFDYSSNQLPRVLRPYEIAKDVGCKFYLGSDAHSRRELDQAPLRFAKIISLLALDEKDKFILGK